MNLDGLEKKKEKLLLPLLQLLTPEASGVGHKEKDLPLQMPKILFTIESYDLIRPGPSLPTIPFLSFSKTH